MKSSSPTVPGVKAAVITRFGGPEVIEIVELDAPEPRAGQVRINVTAAAVNPIDLSTRAGRMTEAGLLAPAPMVGLGWDVAGEVNAVGQGVGDLVPGDAVVGLRDLMFAVPGTYAEQVVLDRSAIARAPALADAAAAATLPLNGLTAMRSLELARRRGAETILVTGAAGAVGGFVLELAAGQPVSTIAVASAVDESLVRRLGADEFIERGDRLADRVRDLVPGGVDAVIDASVLGIEAHDALRSEGIFVALVAPFAPPPIRATRVVVQEVFADGDRLAELVTAADAGMLSLRVAKTLPLDDATRAHALVERGGLRGRVVLKP